MKRALPFLLLFSALIALPMTAAAAPELEALPLSQPSAEMFAMAAAQVTTPTGPTFFYVATAADVNGFESVFSNQITVVFPQGKHIANLTWSASVVPAGGPAIAGYNIWRGDVAGGPYVKKNSALVTGVAYADIFVLPNAPNGLAATLN